MTVRELIAWLQEQPDQDMPCLWWNYESGTGYACAPEVLIAYRKPYHLGGYEYNDGFLENERRGAVPCKAVRL
jgi:hypothetical protein